MLVKFGALFIVIFFFWFCSKKIGLVLKTLVFFLCVDIFNLSNVFGFEFPISLLILLSIWLYFLKGHRKTNFTTNKSFSIVKSTLIFLLILGCLIPFFNDFQIGKYEYAIELSGVSPKQEVFKNATYLLFTFLFVEVYIGCLKRNINFDEIIISTVPFTIILNICTILFLFINVGVPSFLLSKYLTVEGVARYSGTLTDYELITDYCLISICFSFIKFKRTNNFFYIITIISAVVVGLFSGTRSFVFITALFFSLIILLGGYIFKIKNWMIVLIVFSFGILIYNLLSYLPIFSRLDVAFSAMKDGDLNGATNRDYESIPYILSNVRVMGYGLFDFRAFDDTNLPGHNLYLNLLLRFGCISFWYLGVFFIFPLIRLIRSLKNKSLLVYCLTAIIICLMFQQFKINYLRNVNIMLLYVSIALMSYNLKNEQND
jgi:hypothetical protein